MRKNKGKRSLRITGISCLSMIKSVRYLMIIVNKIKYLRYGLLCIDLCSVLAEIKSCRMLLDRSIMKCDPILCPRPLHAGEKRPTTNLPTRTRNGNEIPRDQVLQQGLCGPYRQWLQVSEGSPHRFPDRVPPSYTASHSEQLAGMESARVQDLPLINL